MLRLLITLGVVAGFIYVLDNYNIDVTEQLPLGVLIGSLLYLGNSYIFHKLIVWFHRVVFEYTYKPIILSRKVDSVTASDVREQVRMLWNDSGWERTVGVDSWLEDGDIWVRFIRGNCYNSFSISIEDLSVLDKESKFGCILSLEEDCFSCEDEDELYQVKLDQLSASKNYVKQCHLCEDCLDNIMELGLGTLDSELYVDIAAKNI